MGNRLRELEILGRLETIRSTLLLKLAITLRRFLMKLEDLLSVRHQWSEDSQRVKKVICMYVMVMFDSISSEIFSNFLSIVWFHFLKYMHMMKSLSKEGQMIIFVFRVTKILIILHSWNTTVYIVLYYKWLKFLTKLQENMLNILKIITWIIIIILFDFRLYFCFLTFLHQAFTQDL